MKQFLHLNPIVFKSTVYFMSFLIVLIGVIESLPLFDINLSNSSYLFYLKTLREIFLFLFIGSALVLNTESKHLYIALSVIVFVILVSLSSPIDGILWGTRFLLPLVAISLPRKLGTTFFTSDSQSSIISLFKTILILHVILQFTQLVFSNGYYAVMPWAQLHARNPGLSFYPAAGSLLAVLLVSIINFRKLSAAFHYLGLISITLASSLTGLATLFLYNIYVFKSLSLKQRVITFLHFVGSIWLLDIARKQMTGDTYLNETAGGRIDILLPALKGVDTSFLNHDFGIATNGYFSRNPELGVVLDSLYAALLVNLNLVCIIVFMCFVIYCIGVEAKRVDVRQYVYIILLFLLASCGLIISEAPSQFFLLLVLKFLITSRQMEESPPIK